MPVAMIARLASSGLFRSTVAVLCCCDCALAQTQASHCKGPAELERAIAAHPSAAAYDALGAYFGQQNQLSCALSAFRSAVHLAPGSWEAHYDLAIALLQHGDAQQAVRELRTASGLKPGTPQIDLALGVALSQSNQPAAAIDAFKAVLKIDPKSIPALDGLTKALIAEKRYSAAIVYLKDAPADEVLALNLAIAYSKNGDFEEALQTLAATVKGHPDYAQAHVNLAILYTQQSRYRDAADEFQQALQLDPTDDVARASYIKALIILAQLDTALPLAEDYLRRKPRDFEALYLMGAVDRELGRYTEAEKVLSKAIALQPDHYDSRYDLGFVLAKLGKPAEARVQLEKALQLNPASSEARFQLASILRSLGQKDQANEELKVFQQKKAETVKQDVAGVKVNQANQYLVTGEVQKALNLYREALAEDPNNSRTYYDYALALDRAGDLAAERDALVKSIALDAAFAPAHNQLGLLSLQAGQMADAEQQLKLAISLDPQYSEAQGNLGVLYGQQGKNEEAERLFRQATENNPKYTRAFVNLGLVLATQARFAEAEEVLHHAVQLESSNTSALTADAMVLTRLNRPTEAVASFRKVVELDPQVAEAHLNLGIALADQFHLNDALAEFTEAVRLAPNSAVAHYNRGRVLLDLQRNQEAKPELEAATNLNPKSTESWYLLGLIARQSGDTDAAIRQFSQAADLKPDYADARYMLGRELLHKGDSAGAIEQWRKAIEIQPDYGEALYNLARLLTKSNPEDAKRLQTRFDNLQAQKHVMDRAQTLGNFALASADAHDWPQAIAQLKEGIELCKDCSALPLLHKDLGLIYCRSGELKNGRAELLAAQKLSPADPDVARALQILDSMQK